MAVRRSCWSRLALFAAVRGLRPAGSPDEFLVSRAFLGLAGAGVIVMAISALTVMFSEAERPRAVGIWAAANFLAFPIGPILGGWLLTHFWWGWVFLLNVPVAAIGLAAVVALVPESRAPIRPGLDWLGVCASSVGLAVMTYGLIEAGQHGWSSAGALLRSSAGSRCWGPSLPGSDGSHASRAASHSSTSASLGRPPLPGACCS